MSYVNVHSDKVVIIDDQGTRTEVPVSLTDITHYADYKHKERFERRLTTADDMKRSGR